MQIVADDAIPFLDEAFGDMGEIIRQPGRAIDNGLLRDADVLLTRSVTQVDAGLVRGTALKLVASATAGIDHVDVPALESAGIAFANAPGCNAQGVVEYVLAEVLGWMADRTSRGVPTVGVVGFGQVGHRLVAILRSLGLSVLVNDPPLQQAGTSEEEFIDLEELLARSNVVTLHVPRVTEGSWPTPHLIDASALRRLPAGSLVVNTSRGDVVDNQALLRWLDDGRGSAVLDVWEGEPRLDLRLLPHAALRRATPHIAGYTLEGKARGTAMVHGAVCNHFGLSPTFSPEQVVGGAVPGPAIEETASDVRWLASLLSSQHPLGDTDERTRCLADLDDPLVGPAFERLRKTYRFRHELSHRHRPAIPAFNQRLLSVDVAATLAGLCPAVA